MPYNHYDLSGLAVSHPKFDVVPANIDMFSLDQELLNKELIRAYFNAVLIIDDNYSKFLYTVPLFDISAELIRLVLCQQSNTNFKSWLMTYTPRVLCGHRAGGRIQSAIAASIRSDCSAVDKSIETLSHVRERITFKQPVNVDGSLLAHDDCCDQFFNVCDGRHGVRFG